MNLPNKLDIRLAMLPVPGGRTEAFVIAAPAPLKDGMDLFGRKPGMSGIITYDAGLSWPDRTGQRMAEALLQAGQPVAFGFATVVDALACHSRLLREVALMIATLDDWRPLVRNTLRGFARVRLPERIVLHDCAVHMREGKAWASPPGRPTVGRGGTQMRDATGKPSFTPAISFTSRADADAFSAAVIDAVRTKHPEALA